MSMNCQPFISQMVTWNPCNSHNQCRFICDERRCGDTLMKQPFRFSIACSNWLICTRVVKINYHWRWMALCHKSWGNTIFLLLLYFFLLIAIVIDNKVVVLLLLLFCFDVCSFSWSHIYIWINVKLIFQNCSKYTLILLVDRHLSFVSMISILDFSQNAEDFSIIRIE